MDEKTTMTKKANATALRAILIAIISGIRIGTIKPMSAADYAVADGGVMNAAYFKAYKDKVTALHTKVAGETDATKAALLVANWITSFTGITVTIDDLGVDQAAALARRYIPGSTSFTKSGAGTFRAALEKAIYNVVVAYNYSDSGLAVFYNTKSRLAKNKAYREKLTADIAAQKAIAANTALADDVKEAAGELADTLAERLEKAKTSGIELETVLKSAREAVKTSAAKNSANLATVVADRLETDEDVDIKAIANDIISKAKAKAKAVGKAA